MAISIEVMRPSGKLNAANSKFFRSQASTVLKAMPDVLLIDMQDLAMMDSSGLGALVFILNKARSAGCRLAICSLNEQLRFLFTTTALHILFDIFESRAAFEHDLSAAA
jgi:anti-sigma B factor antagonist